MNSAELQDIGEGMIAAWNTQVVEDVVARYTDDVVYVDPNTRGAVEGADAMRRYLTKLFGRWQMHWEIKEMFPFAEPDGSAVLWHASIATPDGGAKVEVDGMDLVLLEGKRIKRNEVYFDRAALAPLLAAGQGAAATA